MRAGNDASPWETVALQESPARNGACDLTCPADEIAVSGVATRRSCCGETRDGGSHGNGTRVGPLTEEIVDAVIDLIDLRSAAGLLLSS